MVRGIVAGEKRKLPVKGLFYGKAVVLIILLALTNYWVEKDRLLLLDIGNSLQ